MRDRVLRLGADVSKDGLSMTATTKDSTPWADVKDAFLQVRNEINRQLREGPGKCPFSPKRKV